MPITAAAAANASLQHPEMIPERKKINADIRQQTFAWLDKQGYSYTKSQSNCFMLDTRREANQVIAAMQAKKVYIGRVWPAWPTHVRITVGTAQEMQAIPERVSRSNAGAATKGRVAANDVSPSGYAPGLDERSMLGQCYRPALGLNR